MLWLDMCCRFYYSVAPLAQSLAELIHHKKTVVDMLTTHILQVPSVLLGSYLKLTNVLSRYIAFFIYLIVLLIRSIFQ